MIYVNGSQFDAKELEQTYPEGGTELAVLKALSSDAERHDYPSPEYLKFELELRGKIVEAARTLHRSALDFAVFRESKCNPDFWERMENGGFRLKSGVKPSAAIRDIYENSGKYATECATAMLIVYYKALLDIYGETVFDKVFTDITLMNWHGIHPLLRDVGAMRKTAYYLPGDRRYFKNPDVDPVTPEWQGENVIDLGNGKYYGHGIGIASADQLINALNQNRRDGAEKSAFLMEEAGRPNFRRLYETMKSNS